MDERRHNMDGALFVDDERRERSGERARQYYDDGKAEAARRVTQGILDRMDLEATVHVREDDERVVLDIDGPDAGRAIGKKGMTLEALQFLVNKIINRDPDERRHIVLDSGDYRERHDNGLVSMAKREAKRAITSGRAVTLEPMSARDRRVIHVSLAKFPGVSTRSEGEGMDRRLQIIPVRGDRRDDRPRERSGGRDERARDERSARDDRPAARDERSREERPARDDRPTVRDDRARDERPARDERTRDERARDERPARDERSRDDRAAGRDERGARPAPGRRGPAGQDVEPRRERDASLRSPAGGRDYADRERAPRTDDNDRARPATDRNRDYGDAYDDRDRLERERER